MKIFLAFCVSLLTGLPAYCLECPNLSGAFIYNNPNRAADEPSTLENSDIYVRFENKVEGEFRSYAIAISFEVPINSPAVLADGIPHEVARGFGKEFDTYTCVSPNELEIKIDLKNNPYDSEINRIVMKDPNTVVWTIFTKHNPTRILTFIRMY